MSRQSKAAKNAVRAKEFTRMRLAGEKGPSSTQSKHGKRWGYRDNPEVLKRISELMKAEQTGRTALRKVLDGAGKAAE